MTLNKQPGSVTAAVMMYGSAESARTGQDHPIGRQIANQELSQTIQEREKKPAVEAAVLSDGTGVFGTNGPELLDQEGGPMQPTWNSTLSRSAFGLACSDVAVPRRAGW